MSLLTAIAPRQVAGWMFEGFIMLSMGGVLLFRVMIPLRRDLRRRERNGTLPPPPPRSSARPNRPVPDRR